MLEKAITMHFIVVSVITTILFDFLQILYVNTGI